MPMHKPVFGQRRRAGQHPWVAGMAIAGSILAGAVVGTQAADSRTVAGAGYELSVVVERRAGSVELFVGLPAEGLVEVFAMPAAALAGADGTVDFDGLRDGTVAIGEAILNPVATALGGRPVTFEAMSMMVHPEQWKLPLRDPVDGLIAVSVCTVPAPAWAPTLEDLHAYSGFIAYTDDPLQPLHLRFPGTGRAPVAVVVRDFTDGVLTAVHRATVPDGGVLGIDAPA